MRTMMSKKRCNKIKNYIMQHPQTQWSARVSQHISECAECKKAYEMEKKLRMLKTHIPQHSLKLDEEHDFAVRSAILSTAQRIQEKKSKNLGFAPFFKPIGVMLTCLMIAIGWMSWPFISNLPLWDHRAEQRLAVLLQEEPVTLFMTESLQSKRLDTLRFMGKVLDSPEQQKLFLSTSSIEINRSQWIWLLFLSSTTGQDPGKIKDLLVQYGNIETIRKLNLPVWSTIKAFEAYFGPFQKTEDKDTLWVDTSIVAVQWQDLTIQTDALEQPLHIDPLLINQIFPGQQQRIEIKEKDGALYVVSLNEVIVNTVVFEGRLIQADATSLLVSGCSSPIHITENTQFIFTDLHQLIPSDEAIYSIRTIINNDQIYALSITQKGALASKSFTGVLSQRYSFGFMLEGSPVNFYFENLPLISPDKWSFSDLFQRKMPITVEGWQWNDQFKVARIHVIENPLDPIPREDYYFASARATRPPPSFLPPTSREEEEITVMVAADESETSLHGQSDFVVGMTGQTLHLASGRDIMHKGLMITPGSRIEWKGDPSVEIEDQAIMLGSQGKLRSSYIVSRKFDNQVYLLQVEGIRRPVYIFSRESIPEQGMIQAYTMQHDQAIIALESRCFTIGDVVIVKGTIVKTMHQQSWYLMDNNMLFMVDALTQIEGGPILPGSTVTVKGKLTDQSFRAYIVEVSNEILVFTGIIVAMDRDNNMIQLDSGVQFFLDSSQFDKMSEKKLEKGSAVIIKAYREGNIYRATAIYDARDYVSDKGVVT